MEKDKSIFDRVKLPTRIIVHRMERSARALADVVKTGELVPQGGATCELEAGGQVLARGTIVRRRGKYWFKVLETSEEAKS